MRIAVVGAGIAGLTLALWLRRAGLTCTVYEQARQLSEVGAGIQLAPNAVRLLDRVGLAELGFVAVAPESLDLRRWDDGRVLARTRLAAECRYRYGAPYLTLHRADLQRLLLDAVDRAGVPLRLGQRCTDVVSTPDGPRLSFSSGESVDADLVVGADGVRSAVRAFLVEDQARFGGVMVYRSVIDTDQLPRFDAPRVSVWLGPGHHCVWYPVSGGRQYNVVAAVAMPSQTSQPIPVSWRAAAAPDELRRAFQGWHPDVAAVLGAARDVTGWGLYDRPALPRWSRAGVTVVGDAAHAVLPFGAQGANQAIESAATLATCLRIENDLAAALARYERLRAPRLARVQAAVQRNADDHHLADGAGQCARDATLAEGTLRPAQDWLFGYDAEAGALADPGLVDSTMTTPHGEYRRR